MSCRSNVELSLLSFVLLFAAQGASAQEMGLPGSAVTPIRALPGHEPGLVVVPGVVPSDEGDSSYDDSYENDNAAAAAAADDDSYFGFDGDSYSSDPLNELELARLFLSDRERLAIDRHLHPEFYREREVLMEIARAHRTALLARLGGPVSRGSKCLSHLRNKRVEVVFKEMTPALAFKRVGALWGIEVSIEPSLLAEWEGRGTIIDFPVLELSGAEALDLLALAARQGDEGVFWASSDDPARVEVEPHRGVASYARYEVGHLTIWAPPGLYNRVCVGMEPEDIVMLIREHVARDSWDREANAMDVTDDRGGIIVINTPDVHHRVARFLEVLETFVVDPAVGTVGISSPTGNDFSERFLATQVELPARGGTLTDLAAVLARLSDFHVVALWPCELGPEIWSVGRTSLAAIVGKLAANGIGWRWVGDILVLGSGGAKAELMISVADLTRPRRTMVTDFSETEFVTQTPWIEEYALVELIRSTVRQDSWSDDPMNQITSAGNNLVVRQDIEAVAEILELVDGLREDVAIAAKLRRDALLRGISALGGKVGGGAR